MTPCHYVMLSWRHSVMRSRCYHDVMLSCCHDCKSTFAPKARARLVIIRREDLKNGKIIVLQFVRLLVKTL